MIYDSNRITMRHPFLSLSLSFFLMLQPRPKYLNAVVFVMFRGFLFFFFFSISLAETNDMNNTTTAGPCIFQRSNIVINAS